MYKQVGFKFGSYATSRQAIAGADIIIDATPLGMKAGDPAPFDTALLSADRRCSTWCTASARRRGRAGPGGGRLVFARAHARRPAVVTVGILRDITGEAALDIPEDELFRLMGRRRRVQPRLRHPGRVGIRQPRCF